MCSSEDCLSTVPHRVDSDVEDGPVYRPEGFIKYPNRGETVKSDPRPVRDSIEGLSFEIEELIGTFELMVQKLDPALTPEDGGPEEVNRLVLKMPSEMDRTPPKSELVHRLTAMSNRVRGLSRRVSSTMDRVEL